MKLVGKDRWMEIPYGETIERNFAWLRTHHGGQVHFNYTFNKDGTISPEDEADLVWGLADATPCSMWKNIIANHLGWRKTREEKKKSEQEQESKIKDIVLKEVSEILDHSQDIAEFQKIIEVQREMIKDLQS